ncbi:MAG: hypothetical protein HY986_17105 [Candidatus Melainabacteria bacterium]|nr:hypothetical protein [Candidatus Melainabacteria bacterium]
MFVDEYTLLTQTIMPFLRDRWNEIDLVEGQSGERDGRLTKAELEAARERFTSVGDEDAAAIIGELLMRYEAICAAFPDSAGEHAEESLGISREDVSVYAQLWDPEYRKREGKPAPENWMDADNGPEKYWKP